MPEPSQFPQAGLDRIGQAVAAANAALDRALVHGTPEEAASLFTAEAALVEAKSRGGDCVVLASL